MQQKIYTSWPSFSSKPNLPLEHDQLHNNMIIGVSENIMVKFRPYPPKLYTKMKELQYSNTLSHISFNTRLSTILICLT
ncbi:hypothetical protein HanIR_Chr04g0170461 [Helianthus annuus]|nr:hypothetical protein HanIR_Chr04g0170461 [Helianthus annuus]